jgi:glycerol kinase
MEYTLAIDQGTHASRALLVDRRGIPVARHLQPIDLTRPGRGRVEHNPAQILDSVNTVIDSVLHSLPPGQRDAVGACGLATQRSTVLAWRADGTPCSPALSWQDTRGAQQIAALQPQAEVIRRLSGLPLSAHYGATKLHWLARAFATTPGLRLGPLAAFLLDNLTDAVISRIDHTNAQRMQLLDINHRGWSEILLDWFDVPADLLPACAPVTSSYGNLARHHIPITAVCGDQNAAWFGAGRPEAGSALINIGSGAFILAAQDTATTCAALLSTLATSDAERCEYVAEATVNGAGSALQWLQNQYPSDADPAAQLAGWLQQVHTPPLFINTVGGLGSPWWRHDLAPCFYPDSARHTLAERAVAVAESILFLLQANLEKLQRQSPVRHLWVSGGLSRITPLCQKLADVTGLPVTRTQHDEASARGVAWLAAGQPSDWPPLGDTQLFRPQTDRGLRTRYREFIEQLHIRLEAGPHE